MVKVLGTRFIIYSVPVVCVYMCMHKVEVGRQSLPSAAATNPIVRVISTGKAPNARSDSE